MEPEQNINVETPGQNQVNNSAESGNIMEQGLSAVKKPGKGLIAGMIVCAIIAVGGIGFGVWAMLDGNSQKEQLNSQISALKSQNNELQDKIGSSVSTTIIGINNDDSEVNTADYIYVGEWGLKIRILEGLNRVSYSFKQHGGATQTEGTTVSVYGTIGEGLPDFANPYKNKDALGAISKTSKDTYSGPEYDGVEADRRVCGVGGSLVFSDDIYNYCYSGPQVDYSVDENEKEIERKSIEKIKTMLTNKDSYSKF